MKRVHIGVGHMKKTVGFVALPFLLAIIMVLVLPNQAHAILLCRSDPVVILSNGSVLDLSAAISTLPTQVEEVHYELHVPAGLRMVAAIHTPAWLTSQETFAFYSDQVPHQYQVFTTVTTTVGGADVTADSVLVNALGIKLGHYAVSGKEGAWLALLFRG